MYVLIFSNRKGGVGKTTSVLSIGACLGLKRKKVLLIDIDPQANLTQWALSQKPPHTLFQLINKRVSLAETLQKIDTNLYLLPCSNSFSNFERKFNHEIKNAYILKGIVKEIAKKYSFDYVLIDCPPAMNLVTLNAYLVGDSIYVPIEAQKFSYEGILRIHKEVQRIRVKNATLRLGGVFICRYNPRTVLAKSIAKHLEKVFPKLLMKSHIRRNIALEEAPSYHKNIFQYDPKSNGATDYTELTNEILDHYEKR